MKWFNPRTPLLTARFGAVKYKRLRVFTKNIAAGKY